MSTNEIRVAIAVLLLAACSGGDVSADLELWTISTEPATSIGLIEGDPAYLFQRIVDARFTPAGHIIVADGGLSVIREYDGNGNFLAQLGRRGSGPGEFRSLRGIWMIPPDTVGAWDSGALRLTYFGGDRTVARTVSLELASAEIGAGRLDFLGGAFLDGSIVLGSVALAAGLGPDRVTIERISPTGESLGRLAETTGLVRASLAERVNGPIPFSPYPFVATYGGTVYYTNGSEPLVMVASPAGDRTIEFPAHEYDIDREWSAVAAEVQSRDVEPFVHAVATTPHPERIPHLAGLLVDADGNLWAKRYEPLADAIWIREAGPSGGTWWVADWTGRLIATVQVPADFTPLQVEGAKILGIAVDPLGVQRVEIRTVSR